METSKTYLLSILIPTKNRYETLIHVIDLLSSLDNKLVEIVIQDNSDNNSHHLKKLNNFIKKVNFKYFHSTENLSVVENFDQGILNCSGDYICAIGDDDAVMPYILKIVKWMKNNKVLSMNGYKPSYFWPDQKTSYISSNKSGALKFKNWNNEVSNLKVDSILKNITSKGGTIMDKIPSIYHGIIHNSILKKIYCDAGTHFPGPSPDMANAIAITKYIERHHFANLPIFISGKSVKSTGGQGIIHEHVAPIKNVPHLPKNTSNEWDSRIPKYWTGPTIWAESILKVAQKLNLSQIEINFNYLYSYIFTYHFKDRKIIFRKFEISLFKKFICFYYVIIIFINRSINFLSNRNPFIINEIKNVKEISTAMDIIVKIVNPKKLRYFDL